MKIMISQPMKGKTNEQIRTERAELVKELTEQGHEVIDTVFDDFPNGQATPLHYLAKSIEFLANVDGVVFMKGWQNARGCRIEEICAREYGKFIMYL
jgi:Asp-tRNA(Asn)/Glu-tRNA(Gln) amidotransferase A subunit family amidase|nr:MAG TPA: Nucleoside 2-deoxyribosyltransferase like protein [Bacteriophage sp.]